MHVSTRQCQDQSDLRHRRPDTGAYCYSHDEALQFQSHVLETQVILRRISVCFGTDPAASNTTLNSGQTSLPMKLRLRPAAMPTHVPIDTFCLEILCSSDSSNFIN